MKQTLVVAGILVALIAAQVFFVVPEQTRQARQAVEAGGRRVDSLRPILFACMKGRLGFEWKSGDVRGKVCVGGFNAPKVTVYQ